MGVASPIFKDSPSMQQMQKDRKYRRTLEAYRHPIQTGMVIPLEDLERFPAPVVCPHCKNAVITRIKIDRSGKQLFNIGFATFVSVGILTYDVASSNRDFVHECPSCDCALARYASMMNGGYYELKVYRTHDAAMVQNPHPPAYEKHEARDPNASGESASHVQDKDDYAVSKGQASPPRTLGSLSRSSAFSE